MRQGGAAQSSVLIAGGKSFDGRMTSQAQADELGFVFQRAPAAGGGEN
jgi:hypothetical protein